VCGVCDECGGESGRHQIVAAPYCATLRRGGRWLQTKHPLYTTKAAELAVEKIGIFNIWMCTPPPMIFCMLNLYDPLRDRGRTGNASGQARTGSGLLEGGETPAKHRFIKLVSAVTGPFFLVWCVSARR
jgi:hypothetical protein